MGLNATFSINNIQHNDTQHVHQVSLCSAECRIFYCYTVFMRCFVMLSVVAPATLL
jgi:hypothetical protein